MTGHEIDMLAELDPLWAEHVREKWLRLMEIAVWGDLRCEAPGTAGKLRRRSLDLGEKWRSLSNDRAWIPQVRERGKNFLGSALSLRDSMGALKKTAKELTGGGDYGEFNAILSELDEMMAGPLARRENELAAALERLNRDASEDSGSG